MSNKVKDASLAEKEVKVVHGTIFADEFRDRETGKEIGGDSGSYSKEEVDELFAKKSGPLPYFDINAYPNYSLKQFLDKFDLWGKPFIFDWYTTRSVLGIFKNELLTQIRLILKSSN